MNTPDTSDRFFGQSGPDAALRPSAGPVRHRRPAFVRRIRPAVVFAVVAALAVAGLLAWGLRSAKAASDGYTYFPSPSATDGRMLVIAGNMSTLSGSTCTVSFSVPATNATFQLGFFDGNANSGWDVVSGGQPLDTNYTVFADPKGDGSGTTMVAQYLSGAMAANAWTDFPVTNTQTALAPSGRCFYYVRASTTVPTRQSYNAFKIRVAGSTYITPLNTFGYIAANYSGITSNQTYDGTFAFYVEVPQGKTSFDLWDGDFDRNGDTDDPNTANSAIPTWSVTAAQTEGAHSGAPADDGGAAQGAYDRPPDVYYNVVMPDGTSFTNTDPSGDREWELFRLGTSATSTPAPDVVVPAVPAGLWRVDMVGLDVANLCALRFDSPVLGVDASGTIVRPQYPYRLGDRVWFDTNRNGVQDSGEASLTTGAIMTLRDGAGSLIETSAADAGGYYSFTTLPGTYTVDANDAANYVSGGPLAGLMATTARTRTAVITNANALSLDFGFARGPALVVGKDREASSPATAAVGEDTTYTVTVRNAGETTATSIVVTDTIVGTDMAYVVGSTSATYSGGTSSADPTSPDQSTLRWDLGPSSAIGPGSTMTLTYRVRVKPGAAWGAHPDTVAVGAKDASGTPVAPDGHTWIAGDTDPDDRDGATVWVTVPGLRVTKVRSSADATIQAGQNANFTIVVRNVGDARIATVPLTDTFAAANLTYVGASPAASSTSAGSAAWANVGPLDPGQQTTVTVTLAAVAAPPGNVAVDTAEVGPTLDVFGRVVPTASATASVAITRPHLNVTKTRTSGDPAIQVGDGATFSVVVRNDGDTRIGSVSLSDLYENSYITYTTATPAPVMATSSLTTYAVSATDAASTWSNDANSLGPVTGNVATSGNPPFDMWHSFAVPSGITAIDGAAITVRSRAAGGFGSSYTTSANATATKDPTADPAMVRGNIDNGDYADLEVSDNTRLTLREENSGAQNLAASFANMEPFTEAADTAVSRIVVTAEGYVENNEAEAAYVRFWNYGTGAWSTTWYQLGTANWSGTETTYIASVTNTAEIQNYLNSGGAFQVQFADNDYRAGRDDDNRTRFYLGYLRVSFGYTTTTTANRDDTWAIQYSTNAGSSWSNITPASNTSEGSLTDHILDLAGILTTSNIADFRVRIVGAVVGSADNTGTATWDTSKLDLTYKSPPSDGSLSWANLGALDPGQQATVMVSFVASACPPGLLTTDTASTAGAIDVNGDTVPGASGSASVAVTRPGIAISKSLAPSQPTTVGIGAPVTFQVLLTNTGNTTVTEASVVDTWSASYLDYVSASPAATSVGAGTATWTNLPPIAPGDIATLTITYTSLAPPPGGATVNRVRAEDVSDAYGDPIADAAAQASVGISDARVSVTKTRTSPDPIIVVGQAVTYSVLVRNTGVTTLANVPLSDVFEDDYLDFTSASLVPSSTAVGSLTWNDIGPLAPGQQRTVTLDFVATAPTSGRSTVDTATVAGAVDVDGIEAGPVSDTASVVVRWSAVITALATNAPTTNTDVAVTSSVHNDLAVPIDDSTVTYVMWWDSDSRVGTFDAGDIYIDSSGLPHAWDGVTPVTSHVTTGVNVAANGTTEPSRWTVNNQFFPNEGTYNVTATWRESNDTLIDVATSQFYSIPAMGWPLFALTALLGGAWLWRRRDRLAPVASRPEVAA